MYIYISFTGCNPVDGALQHATNVKLYLPPPPNYLVYQYYIRRARFNYNYIYILSKYNMRKYKSPNSNPHSLLIITILCQQQQQYFMCKVSNE